MLRNRILQSIAESGFINCVLNEEKFNSLIFSFNDISKTKWATLTRSAPKKQMSVFIPCDISQPENLNDYIQADWTVRHPIKATPKIEFYHEGKISLDKLGQVTTIRAEDVGELLNSVLIIRSFKSRIEKILFK